jgi:hypothetical protein
MVLGNITTNTEEDYVSLNYTPANSYTVCGVLGTSIILLWNNGNGTTI